ncbi:DUF2007 domain-containing protein [Myroides marinus]|jgi:Tfp pilus assembly pilus retraction ATPase PilT|uniref:DUF2007 domain-containing protein n=1 Tax=Myroides marinus TaxID=703342 RepID=A0A161UTC1_9FLAO|nr:DUF2007 domain-containing protein [Myroides marinus]MDR0195792.1 DUF2007 domain-containing protein [Myroides sp.]KUF43454.1 hypothetical protein AS361_11085 [Myroides marinus]KZE80981.1 hypothetical protein AV926_09415 [Myroides marinus]MDM1346118.1 DUF2007 domain-containing protein [Myroides marinus]MDM1351106.1 DUF2007 domain-containing protein [Myroides marinus]
MSHKKLFAGSEIMVLAVRNLLEENNIPYIIRDDIESAIRVGYGTLDKAVHVLVEEENLDRAKALLEENDLRE